MGTLLLGAMLFAGTGANLVFDLTGKARDPFASATRARVFIFVRTDCTISNRYAAELDRITKEFKKENIDFWLVYPDPETTAQQIRTHMVQYGFSLQPLRDPQHEMVKLAKAVTSPEAAVFDMDGKLIYRGRIDDLWVDPGKARPEARTHDLEDVIAAVIAGQKIAQPETRAVGCPLVTK
jgi:hypothetical protein